MLQYFCTSPPKKKDFSRDNDRIRKHHVTMTKTGAYISNDLQHQSHSLIFVLKYKTLFSDTSVLSQRPNFKTYNTTASLDKLTCTNYMDFGKNQDRFVDFCPQMIPITWMWNLRYSRKMRTDFRLVQTLTKGEPTFNQCISLNNQLVYEEGELWYTGQLVPHANINNVQKNG